mmetsp:Transcript_33270/g.86273  ORF Transcript_33270/g.86273 Transcript_33270/m.86273 type:complete len:218 (-) Transcript_33270:492-1145(-)
MLTERKERTRVGSECDGGVHGPLAAELAELEEGVFEVGEERILAPGVSLKVGREDGVVVQRVVGGQPQQVVPVLQVLQLVVAVVKGEPLLGPGHAAGHAVPGLAVAARHMRRAGEPCGGRLPVSIVHHTRALAEGAPNRVRARQRDNVLVGQAHPVKHVPDVSGGIHRAVTKGGHGGREVAFHRALGGSHSPVAHGDSGPPDHLNRSGACQLDEVRP